MLAGLRAPPPRHSGVRLTWNQDKIALLASRLLGTTKSNYSALPRVDTIDDDAGRECGVYHLTALTACYLGCGEQCF